MAGTQPVLGSTTATAMTSSSTAAVTAGASGTARPPAQALTELLEALATLMGVEVTPDNQEHHKVDVAKLRDEIAQAKEELSAENARMTAGGFGRSSSADSVTGFPAYDGSERVE